MASPLEDLAFLAASRNRVDMLETLAEGSHDRRGLQAALDISQPTASRILRDCQERGWVVRTSDGYTLTPMGESVVAAFVDFRERLETTHHLRDILPLLPDEAFDFEIARLRSADIVQVSVGARGLARAHELAHIAAGDHLRILTEYAPRKVVEEVWRQVMTEGLDIEVVLETDAVSNIQADSDLSRWHREMLKTDRAELYRFEGDIPAVLYIVDETVHIGLPGDEEPGGAWISTDDEMVFNWAERTFEEYRDQGVPLEAKDFPN